MSGVCQARWTALRVLKRVVGDGRSLTVALDDAIGALEGRDKSLCRALCYGVLRWYPRFEIVVMQWVDKPLKARDLDVKLLIFLGLYQLFYTRISSHAAIAETVELCRKAKKLWAKGLVNAVLRRAQREQVHLDGGVEDVVARYAHPQWLIDSICQDWPEDFERVFDGNNSQAPMVLRVNRKFNLREDYLKKLDAVGIHAEPTVFSDDGLILQNALDVDVLPGFSEGACSVQDEAAQLAAGLLQLDEGLRVLDACCAPGGKAAHMLEMMPTLELVAVDSSKERLRLVEQTFQRLACEMSSMHVREAQLIEQWWDGVLFDRILLDAPCSATGVIRRHPDIKSLRLAEDIDALVCQQKLLLEALWKTLKPGGILLYATCSVLKAENVDVVSDFLRRHMDAEELPIDVEWGCEDVVGRQILPGEAGMDGFYYARFMKRED